MLSIEQQFPTISGYSINPMTIFGIPKNHIMKTNLRVRFLGVFFVLLLGAWSANARFSSSKAADSTSFNQFKGSILDSKTRNELVYASISVLGTSISTISNSEGKFAIKVPKDNQNASLVISFLGYKNKVVSINELKAEKNILYLEPSNTVLEEVVVNSRDAKTVFLGVLNNRLQNYGDDPLAMTGFYRETIKKRRTYVSLSESIVKIQKEPFTDGSQDLIDLFKGRKNTDYTKLDTVNFKLQGGPFSALYIDLVKYPSNIFSEDAFELYDFNLEEVTQINGKQVLVLAFKQKSAYDFPLYYGKLFIDAKSLAVVSASFALNVEDKVKAGRLFTRKKPLGLDVFPTEVRYQINYREQNGKWIYAYSRADLTFKLNWDKRIFNTVYTTTVEMAVTDWKKSDKKEPGSTQKLNSNVIMSDKVSSLSDPDFWGAYNIIEPEKSIETAIRKIQKKALVEGLRE
ncbi:carboxypeptidase-like regulatory domain-containing protein [Aquirufa novilacunae]|uniref:Carboxypeptidase-like regulatory domain-containing protein n=1 Tax=Aquirufa novilacunae TaxID=3139305 RepID=A0ABW8U349_9BACT